MTNRMWVGVWLLLASAQAAVAAEPVPAALRIQRLAWAGIKLEYQDTTLLIDAVQSPGALGAIPPVPIEITTPRRYFLITHLHNDHYDRALLQSLQGERGRAICHRTLAADVASDGLRVRSVDLGESLTLGPFTVVPVAAADGLGDDQVSWVVSVAGRRLIHAGDTLWHGGWARLGAVYGPFDMAFLPINAAVVGEHPSALSQPISMSPEQAVAAALQLRANAVCPIHFGQHDTEYQEIANPEQLLVKAAQAANLALSRLAAGGRLELPAIPWPVSG